MNETQGQNEYLTTKLTKITDTAEISELLSRFCSMVDDKSINITALETIFTQEGRIINPNGSTVTGPVAIKAEKTKSFNRFRATQHITSDHTIELEEDTARLRANMLAMHLWSPEDSDPLSLQTHFVAGGVFDATAVRTAEGWRFSELKSRITWRTGSGMSAVAKTGMK